MLNVNLKQNEESLSSHKTMVEVRQGEPGQGKIWKIEFCQAFKRINKIFFFVFLKFGFDIVYLYLTMLSFKLSLKQGLPP